jgi:predicted alpha/beta hydrolase family esterase
MRVAEADILIVPGWKGSEPDHWQSRWLQKLSSARKVEQEDWEKPRRAEWQAAIQRAVVQRARPVVVVAHSLGCLAFLHAAQNIGGEVAGAFLVAPPSERSIGAEPDIDPNFLPYPRARLPFPSALVAAADDPYAELGFARQLALDLGAEFLDAGASGHINVASGHGPWPEGSMTFAHFLAKL